MPMTNRPVIVSVEVETSTGHRLMDYKGKCANLHGHNYRWVIEVADHVSDMRYGMAIDFTVLKNLVKQLTDIFDHGFVLRDDDPMCDKLREDGSRLIVMSVNPTAENMAQYLANEILSALPTIEWVNVTLWETSKCQVNARGNERNEVQVVGYASGKETP